VTRSGPTRSRMRILASIGDRWARAGRRSCVTRSGHTDVHVSSDCLLSILYRRSRLMIPNVLFRIGSSRF
jgi:hypothetical protein